MPPTTLPGAPFGKLFKIASSARLGRASGAQLPEELSDRDVADVVATSDELAASEAAGITFCQQITSKRMHFGDRLDIAHRSVVLRAFAALHLAKSKRRRAAREAPLAGARLAGS